jgi:hypothetical protein
MQSLRLRMGGIEIIHVMKLDWGPSTKSQTILRGGSRFISNRIVRFMGLTTGLRDA